MSENIKFIRVFIGSPGGLEDERRAAREVIDEVNLANSEHWGCHFKLVGWEDTIPSHKRAQSLINADLDKCQYFIGVLWDRWGTKPDLEEGGFTSGFEEEFCRARGLCDAGLMKDIVLYFKEFNVPKSLEPGAELKKVKDFRLQCIDEKREFFKDFVDTADFRDLVRRKITEIGWKESKMLGVPEPRNSEAEQSQQENSDDKEPLVTKIFDANALDFISKISSRTHESEQTSPSEIARFRLIAASLKKSGNDELYLGNHDANLIFRHRNEMSLSGQEISGLVVCGIVGFDHQNVPLWRWLAAASPKNEPSVTVKVLAVMANSDEKKNAIKLLQIFGHTVADLEPLISREGILTNWLQSEENIQIFDAAAQFLSTNGMREDIETIDKISAGSPAEKKAKLDAIVASIKARSSYEEAIRYICANNVEKMSKRFVDMIFSKPSALPTEVLSLCLVVRSDDVRLRAVELLIGRGELAQAEAENLLSDSSHQIRLLVVESFQGGDKPLSRDTIKTVLTIKRGSRAFNVFQSAETDETYYDRYLVNRLKELDFDKLKERVAEAGVFKDKELLVFYRKFSRKLSDNIRENLRDRFATMFEESVKKVEAIGGSEADYRTRYYKLFPFYQKKLCSGALAVLCGLNVNSDIGLVRATLDAIEVELSIELLAYLARFGDWSDIVRIERLVLPSSGKLGLSNFSYNIYADEKAAAILELGKSRIADLLKTDLSTHVRKSLIKLFPKSVLGDLSNEAIIGELNSKDDEYRVIFSLRCVESLPKERIETILDLYIERDGQRYYNSIHWLDLGASLLRKHATAIVRRELVRRSQ